MIKKTRLKFIGVTTAILTVVIAAVAVVLVLMGYSRNNAEVQRLLSAKLREESVGGTFNQFRSFSVEVEYNDKSGVYTLLGGTYDSPFFTTDTINYYVNELFRRNVPTACKIGNVYFMAKMEPSARNVWLIDIVGVDRTVEESMLSENNVSIIIVALSALSVLVLVVWRLSFWIIKPVNDAFERQKLFIADASHELKTPVTIINANVDVLRDADADSEWLNNIEDQTKRMSLLIQDMLDLARVEEKRSDNEKITFDLSQTVERAALAFDALSYESGKTLSIETVKTEYLGSESDVKKITEILVDNAVKYCDEKGNVRVSLVVNKNSKPCLNVFNSGCEIEKKDKDRIFERFYRGENSRNRKTGGSGLGLAIAKALSDKNHWKITADCEKGEYMNISVEF